MSGFFGIFRPQGGPVDLEAFEQMKTAMHREGFDGMETHVEEKIALGHLMLRVSPESQYDKQPLKSSCGNYLLVGHFRLDYRDELGDKLGLTQAELEVTPDSQLAMLAYQRWKEKCVHHLEGDWAFVVFNIQSNQLLLARDSAGVSSLFFLKAKGNLYFASDSRYLLLIRNISFEIDKEKLFQMASLYYQSTSRQTLLVGLNSIKSGELLVINTFLDFIFSDHNKFRIFQNLKYKYSDDYISELNYTYSTAIKSRLNDQGSVGIYLSGGKDSSSVSYFSAKELEFKKKELFSFTSVPLHELDSSLVGQKIVDETDFVNDLIATNKNIKSSLLKFQSYQLDTLFQKTNLFEPYNPVVTINSFWLNGIINEAKLKGIRTLLTGQLGNETITFNGFYYYSDLLIRFKLFSIFQEFKREYIFSDKKLGHLLKHQLLIPLAQHLKFTYSTYWHKRLSKLPKFFNNFPIDRFKKKQLFSNEIQLFKNLFTSNKRKREDQLKRDIDLLGNIWYLISNHLHVQIADPTSDLRLIKFLYSIPQYLFFQNCIHKSLFRSLMKNRLPDSILWNNKYQYQSYDFTYRLADDKRFAFFFKKMLSEDPSFDFFNKTELLTVFNKIVTSPGSHLGDQEIYELLRSFSLNCFSHYNFKR